MLQSRTSSTLQRIMMFISKRIPLKLALKLGAAILLSVIGAGVASAGSPLSDLIQRVLPSTDNIAKPPIDDAEFVSQDVPNLIAPGQVVQVSITLKNTGTSTWTRAAGYKLGSQNPQDNKTWTGGTRIYLDRSESIAPGQRKTFTFKITAPSKPGLYPFQWRMVHEGVSWFGRHSRNVMIRVKVPDDARFVSQSVPSSLQPGQKTQVSITLENIGTSTWTRSAKYKLGSQNPQDNKTWTGGTRIYLDRSESIAPGQRKTFTFEITAPSKPGLYPFQWRMVREDVGWFGQHSRNIMIRVKAPAGDADNAQFVSQNVPTSLQAGQTAQVSITMMNTGTTTWTWGAGYKLGSQNPQDNKRWMDDISVLLSPSDRIAPGSHKTFFFTITAPEIPGDYDFQWRMANGGARRFGDFTPNIIIRVTPRERNTPHPPPGDYQPSFPIRAAFYYPWFPQAWKQKGMDPFTKYRPSLEYYDSGKTSVIQKHLDAMEYAHIEVGIASWWGPGHYTDQNLVKLLQTTTGRRFRWAIYYEDEGQEEGRRNPKSDTIREHLEYIAANYGSDPSFLRIDGRFVVFVYGGHETCDMADRWAAANTVNAYIVLKVFLEYRDCRNQPDGWHQYGPVKRTDSQGEFSYTISPGFWLGNETEPRLERDLNQWYGNVRSMVASDARFHLITTFNEWGEGTSVESAENWESSSGFGDYLDALAKNGVGFIPIKVTPSSTPTPSISLTPTPGLTPSPTATSTPIITPTSTSEVTPSPTATSTPIITPTSTSEVTPPPTATPTPYISPTPTSVSVIWEDDDFDSLAIGPLHGQNGWRNGQASARVIPFEGGGKVLEIDPDPGVTINMGKNVAKLQNGIHRFEFDVMVDGATEPSLAKIEMRTNANAGWDKKFQLYFGSSMRVNYSPSGAATNIVQSTQMGRWYHIRCDMDLDSGKMDVWVDGVKVASSIPMHPGPIVGLSLSGWDRAGAVYLDNLLGSN